MLNKPVKVGDILCKVLRYPEKGAKEYYDVKVVRLGKKYIYVQREESYKEHRYTKEGLADDDYSRSHGVRSELYHTEEEYLGIKGKAYLWSMLIHKIRFTSSPPSYLTLDEIKEIYTKIFPEKTKGEKT
jgi:hypothetical protein